MKRKNVRVSLISPGFIKTPMTDQNDFPMPFIKSPEFAAKEIYLGLIKKKAFEIHFPRIFTFMMKIIQLLPNWLYFGVINFGNKYMGTRCWRAALGLTLPTPNLNCAPSPVTLSVPLVQ